jgi:hypothetical protein
MKTLIIILLSLTPAAGKTQSLAQLIQQLQLDYQKLAQLKDMLAEMYTAYNQVHDGYEQVLGIAHGNFDLHKTFLDGLLAVNPVVKDYFKVERIIDNESELAREYKAGGANAFYDNLLDGSLRNLEELTAVLTDNTLRMNDAERLTAIDRIDEDMTNRLTIMRSFSADNAILRGQRTIELNDIKAMQGLYGIK